MRETRLFLRLTPLSFLFGLSAAQCPTAAPEVAAATRFRLTASNAARAPVYAQVTTQEDQPGWIEVSHAGGARVYLRARCEVPDCGRPEISCGAAVPLVRDIARGSIESEWDGTESIFDGSSGCETRRPAPPGRYVAKFCYAHEAAIVAGSGSPEGVQGTIERPLCTDVPFTLPGAGVVSFTVPAGTL